MQQKTIQFRPNFPVGLLFSSLLFVRTPYHYFFEDHGPHIVSFLFQICIEIMSIQGQINVPIYCNLVVKFA
jgi:hypothetical protein